MGYWVDTIDVDVAVTGAKARGALDALKQLHLDEDGGCRSFSWVDGDEAMKALQGDGDPSERLATVLGAWGYNVDWKPEGVVSVVWRDLDVPLGDYDALWPVLGPFVEPGLMTFRGEDGALFGYRFTGECAEALRGVITWETEGGDNG